MSVTLNLRSMVLSISLLVVCNCSRFGSGSSHVDKQLSDSTLRAEYDELSKRAALFNQDKTRLSYWWLNSEHCFMTDLGPSPKMLADGSPDLSNNLRIRVINFVRRPGAVDFLFGRLLQKDATNSEVLVDTEMLMYVAGHDESSHETFAPSARANDILRAVKQERFRTAETEYPEASITNVMKCAATQEN